MVLGFAPGLTIIRRVESTKLGEIPVPELQRAEKPNVAVARSPDGLR
jgi:hypothetical protein